MEIRTWTKHAHMITHESTQSGVDISPWAALAAIFPATEMAGKGYPLATPGVFGVDAAELTQARWVASNDRQVVAIHNAIVRIFVSRNRVNAPLLGHPYTTRVIKVDKHTKERTRGLAQLSVLALPIEMPLHLSSPTWVLSKVWAKCKAPEGQERKEAQLHQCNEDISSNTHTHTHTHTKRQRDMKQYEGGCMKSCQSQHDTTNTHSCIHVCWSSTSVSSLPLSRALPYLQMASITHWFNNLNSTKCFFSQVP